MARYSIVKRQRKYYKYGTEPNVTVVGSPTIEEGVVSGFSSANHLILPKNFDVSNGSTWEMVYKVKTGENITTIQCVCGHTGSSEYDPVSIGIKSSKFFISSLSKGSASSIKTDTSGTYVVSTKTDYWLKMSFDGSQYVLSYSLDGIEYVEDVVVASTAAVWASNLAIGRQQGSASEYPWLGSIDFTQSYIKVNGQDWWHGTKVVESTEDEADYYVDNNKLYQLAVNKRSYWKYQDWEQPSLTANGTLGGDSFAVTASVEHNGTWGDWRTYHAFNGDLSDKGWSGNTNTLPQHIIFYNPEKLLVSNIRILNHEGNNGGFTAGNIYGSNNGSDWVLISPFTNDVITKGVAWDIALPSNRTLYKYHKIEITATQGFSSTNTVKCKEIYITAKTSSKSTEADYDYYTDRNVAYNLVYKPYEVISQTFNVSDELQTYVVPEGVNKVSVVCTASRGNGNAGAGGSVKCDLSVTEGQTLYIMVGGVPTVLNTASYNASDIRINGTEYENRIIVAGGGGSGTGTSSGNLSHSKGGAGGGLVGGDAKAVTYQAGGFGGTQEAGGAASYRTGGGVDGWVGGAAGSYAIGGNGGLGSMYGSTVRGGAGGAGYYGGGGGGVYDINSVGISFAGGGGGSSYTDSTLCENVVHLQGINNGEGYVKISYIKELK